MAVFPKFNTKAVIFLMIRLMQKTVFSILQKLADNVFAILQTLSQD